MSIRTIISVAAASMALTVTVESFARKHEPTSSQTVSPPWGDIHAPPFQTLIYKYALTELAEKGSNRDSIADAILLSDADSFDSYTARKEAGLDNSEARAQAIRDVESAKQVLDGKQFLVKTTIPFEQYDPTAQGFPLYVDDPEIVTMISISNKNVRVASSENTSLAIRNLHVNTALPVRGFGFTDATIAFHTNGWLISATPEEAAEFIKPYVTATTKRKISVAIVYTVDSCLSKKDEHYEMWCNATVQAIYGYRNDEELDSNRLPTLKIVHAPRDGAASM